MGDTAKYQEARGLIPLWIGLLTGPIVWAAHMEANFALVEWACPNHDWIIHAVSVAALLIVAVAGLVAARAWKDTGGQGPDEQATLISRSRYMAIMGMVLSAGFFLVILAQEIPSWFLTACQ